jgi:hypothetical protein
MSRKVFTAGEVLAAADVNSFLMDQSVMSFAGTAARGSAIPSPVEGMTAYLEDSNILSLYDGSAWKTSLATTGSILQVVTDVEAVQVSTTSASFVTSNAEATITPKSTNSRILILVSGMVEMTQTPQSVQTAIYRGGAGGSEITNTVQDYYQSTGNFFWTIGLNHLDSPNTTSATTYTLMFRKGSGIGGVNIQPSGSKTNITLLEVAG